MISTTQEAVERALAAEAEIRSLRQQLAAALRASDHAESALRVIANPNYGARPTAQDARDMSDYARAALEETP